MHSAGEERQTRKGVQGLAASVCSLMMAGAIYALVLLATVTELKVSMLANRSVAMLWLLTDHARPLCLNYFAVNSDLTRELIPHLGETLINIRLRGRMSCPGQPPRTDDDART